MKLYCSYQEKVNIILGMCIYVHLISASVNGWYVAIIMQQHAACELSRCAARTVIRAPFEGP